MSMELLLQLSREGLPRYFSEPADIDRVAICQAAGFIDAEVPPVLGDGVSYTDRLATVFRISPRGYTALAEYIRTKKVK